MGDALAADLEKELKAALKGPSMWDRFMNTVRAIMEPMGCYLSIPPYQPDNQDWEITFTALGLDYKTVNMFYKIFYKMNKTHDGEVSMIEFMNFFNLDRTPYVVKAFAYCDTVGGGEMDFLEFVVSVWNFCTLKAETLVNFTFDLYDIDDDGEIAYDEIEGMIRELYGPQWDQSMLAREALNEMALLSEKYGGGIPLDAFIRFQTHHSMLLFPCFVIQRAVQEKVMGIEYWMDKADERKRSIKHGERLFDPRHVQSILRTYKTGSAAAILTHTGDPNEGLREWIAKGKEEPPVDPEKVKEEIARRRGAKLTLIAEWRRRVNPKMRDEYKEHLVEQAKIQKALDQKRADEAAELLRLAEEKAAEDEKKYKKMLFDMIKNGEELDLDQQQFALEHDLYTAVIAGAEAAKLLKEEDEEKERLRMIEVEKEREKMLMEREEQPESPDGRDAHGEDEEVALIVKGKKSAPIGSNGRPKVHRKGRRMADEGRWVDRPPPSAPAPDKVVVVDAPTTMYDRKGRPLKKRKSARNSKRGSKSTSKINSRAQSPELAPVKLPNSATPAEVIAGRKPNVEPSIKGGRRKSIPTVVIEDTVVDEGNLGVGAVLFSPKHLKRKEEEMRRRMNEAVDGDTGGVKD